MKISDLEDADKIVTKEYLDNLLTARLERLKSDILQQLIASERGQRLLIWGLYTGSSSSAFS
jgi:hypothetical protein